MLYGSTSFISASKLGEFAQVASILVLLPAVLVGAIIPFLVLVLQAVNRTPYSFLIIGEERTRLMRVVVSPLIALVLLIAIVSWNFFARAPVDVTEWILLGSLAFTLYALWETVALLHHATSVPDPAYVLRRFERRLSSAVYVSLYEEMTYRNGKRRLRRLAENLGLMVLPVNRPGVTALAASKTGEVADVSIPKLREALSGLTQTFRSGGISTEGHSTCRSVGWWRRVIFWFPFCPTSPI